jgi:hypothetical protein
MDRIVILQLALQHVKDKGRSAIHQIWDVPAEKIAILSAKPKTALVNSRGDVIKKNESLESFVSDIIKAKLPTYLYNFQVTDWEFKDPVSSYEMADAGRSL